MSSNCLEGSDADVDVKGRFRSLSPTRAESISEEVFTFKDGTDEAVSPSVKEDIQAAHRRHMEDFRRLAENQSANVNNTQPRFEYSRPDRFPHENR